MQPRPCGRSRAWHDPNQRCCGWSGWSHRRLAQKPAQYHNHHSQRRSVQTIPFAKQSLQKAQQLSNRSPRPLVRFWRLQEPLAHHSQVPAQISSSGPFPIDDLRSHQTHQLDSLGRRGDPNRATPRKRWKSWRLLAMKDGDAKQGCDDTRWSQKACNMLQYFKNYQTIDNTRMQFWWYGSEWLTPTCAPCWISCLGGGTWWNSEAGLQQIGSKLWVHARGTQRCAVVFKLLPSATKHKFRFQIDYKILQWHLLCLCQIIALTSMFLSVFPWPKKRQHVRAIHCAWLSKYLRLSADWTVRKNSCNTTVFVKHGRDLQDRVIYGDGLCSLLPFMFLSLLFSCASQSGSYQLSVTCHECPCCMLNHSDSFHRTLAPKIRPQIPLKNCRQTESYDHSFCPLSMRLVGHRANSADGKVVPGWVFHVFGKTE